MSAHILQRFRVRLLAGIACLIGAGFAFGQSRVSDKDLEALMRNLRDDAKSFRPVFGSALHKSSIRKTSREKEAKDLAVRFVRQTNAMLSGFKQNKKVDTTLPQVRNTAQQIDALVMSLNLGPQTNSRWNKIQTELQQVAAAFNVQNTAAGENSRGITPYARASDSDPNAPSCLQTAGPEHSRRLVEDCLAVSPATHPPCNTQNSCALIISEIKRSCALLDPRSAPAFCRQYR